jgi:glycosyltransferase involved in cell wall biosynthesis
VELADPRDFTRNSGDVVPRLNRCDIVHLQYEPSLFLDKRRDMYTRICRMLEPTRVVSLHEVYAEFPWAYPRSRITGTFLTRPLKRLVYDVRHPHITAYRRHVRSRFHARRVVVHCSYQRDLMIAKGIPPAIIEVLPHPAVSRSAEDTRSWDPSSPLRLCAAGFLNPTYDYKLLLEVLEGLEQPWDFTWIGGPRGSDDEALEKWLLAEAAERGWGERFRITGWVNDEHRDRLLDTKNIFCAFFRHRSTSGGIATAISAGMCIVATKLPLTTELADEFGVLRCAEATPHAIRLMLTRIATEPALRSALMSACGNYVRHYSYSAMAARQLESYRELTGRSAA